VDVIISTNPHNAMQIYQRGYNVAFIPTPNAIELVVHFTLAGIPCSITLTVGNGGVPPSLSDLEDAATVTNGWVTDTLLDWISDDVELNGVTAYDLTSDSSPLHNLVNTTPPVGLVASPSQAMNAAIVASLRSANRGRSGRGRNFLMGVPNNVVIDAAHVSTTHASNILGAYITGLAVLAFNGFTWCVNSKYTEGAPRTTGFLQEVESVVVNNEFDTKDRTPL